MTAHTPPTNASTVARESASFQPPCESCQREETAAARRTHIVGRHPPRPREHISAKRETLAVLCFHFAAGEGKLVAFDGERWK